MKNQTLPEQLKKLRTEIESTCQNYKDTFGIYERDSTRHQTILDLKGRAIELEKELDEIGKINVIGPRVFKHEGGNCSQLLIETIKNIANGQGEESKEIYLQYAPDQLEKIIALTPLIEMEMIDSKIIQENSNKFEGAEILDREIAHYSPYTEKGKIKITKKYEGKNIWMNTYDVIFKAVASTILGDAINNTPLGTEEKEAEIKVDLSQDRKYTTLTVTNNYDPEKEKNFPQEIGMGNGTGGRFLRGITKVAKGTLVNRYSAENENGEGTYTAQIKVPNKYIQTFKDYIQGINPETLERLNRMRAKKSLDAIVVK